tara:strand:- start:165 stop:1178 length:1014 start_codon:yes stop_codon:yes gene_type:complete
MTLDDAMIENNLITDLRLSFSRVSEFDRNGPRSLIDRKKISGEFLDFGSLVDDMLQPDFNITDKYYVFDGEKPTAMLGLLCDQLITNMVNSNPNLPADDYKILLLTTIKNLGLWKTTKDDDKLVAKFTPNALEYVTAMIESTGKTLVTNLLVQEAEEMVSVLKTHEFSRDFILGDLEYQVEINFEIGNFKFLSFLDYIKIDHVNKTIRGIDLKTGSKPVSEFLSNFIKYRYYLQAVIYKNALFHYKKVNNLKDYKVLPFQFLYCGRYEKIPTFIEISDKWNKAARYGFDTKSGYKHKGLYELVDNIEWHWRNEIFNMSREQCENNGLVKINDEFINI